MHWRLLTSILTFFSEISHFIFKKKRACAFASMRIQITYEQKSASFLTKAFVLIID